MEEDINILEEFKTKGYSMLFMKYGDRNTTNLRIERAIENLIKGYRELEERNNKYMNGELFSAKQVKKFEEERNKYYIHKSKVKEIIEELKQYNYKGNLDDIDFINKITNELQELMEDK